MGRPRSSASRSSDGEGGFTLLEAVVAIAFLLVAMSLVYESMARQTTHARDGLLRLTLRTAATNLATDLRAAVMYDGTALAALAGSAQQVSVADPRGGTATFACTVTVGAADSAGGASSSVRCAAGATAETVQLYVGVQAPEPGASLTPLPRST